MVYSSVVKSAEPTSLYRGEGMSASLPNTRLQPTRSAGVPLGASKHAAKPPSNDRRNLVDRWIERVKNNRVAAIIIIIIGIVRSALAGLTDTLKKLSDPRLPSSRIVGGHQRARTLR
jgi:hypothetical protein